MEPTFTRDQIEALRESLTMLDIYRARKLTKEQVEVGLEAYRQAALRTELVPEGTTLEEFLGRLRADDFNEIMGATKTPLGTGGGSVLDSSAPTATPPPNS